MTHSLDRCRANMAHRRQARSIHGLGSQLKVFNLFWGYAWTGRWPGSTAPPSMGPPPHRCPTNIAHVRQTRLDHGHGFQLKVFQFVVRSSRTGTWPGSTAPPSTGPPPVLLDPAARRISFSQIESRYLSGLVCTFLGRLSIEMPGVAAVE